MPAITSRQEVCGNVRLDAQPADAPASTRRGSIRASLDSLGERLSYKIASALNPNTQRTDPVVRQSLAATTSQLQRYLDALRGGPGPVEGKNGAEDNLKAFREQLRRQAFEVERAASPITARKVPFADLIAGRLKAIYSGKESADLAILHATVQSLLDENIDPDPLLKAIHEATLPAARLYGVWSETTVTRTKDPQPSGQGEHLWGKALLKAAQGSPIDPKGELTIEMVASNLPEEDRKWYAAQEKAGRRTEDRLPGGTPSRWRDLLPSRSQMKEAQESLRRAQMNFLTTCLSGALDPSSRADAITQIGLAEKTKKGIFSSPEKIVEALYELMAEFDTKSIEKFIKSLEPRLSKLMPLTYEGLKNTHNLRSVIDTQVAGLIEDASKDFQSFRSTLADKISGFDLEIKNLAPWYSGGSQVRESETRRALEKMDPEAAVLLHRGLRARRVAGEDLPPEIKKMEDSCRHLIDFKRVMNTNLAKLEAPVQTQTRKHDGKTYEIPISQSSYMDLCRRPYRVGTDSQSVAIVGEHADDGEGGLNPAADEAPERTPPDIQDAVERMSKLVTQGDTRKMGQILRFAHQGVWAGIELLQGTPNSPFLLDGVPGVLTCDPERKVDYLFTPQQDGSTLITCTARFEGSLRFRPHDALSGDGEKEIPLSKDSSGTLRMEIVVAADGKKARYKDPDQPVSFNMNLLKRSAQESAGALLEELVPSDPAKQRNRLSETALERLGADWRKMTSMFTPDALVSAFENSMPPSASPRQYKVLQKLSEFLGDDDSAHAKGLRSSISRPILNCMVGESVKELAKQQDNLTKEISGRQYRTCSAVWADIHRTPFEVGDETIRGDERIADEEQRKLDVAQRLAANLPGRDIQTLLNLLKNAYQDAFAAVREASAYSTSPVTLDGKPMFLLTMEPMERTFKIAQDDARPGRWTIGVKGEIRHPILMDKAANQLRPTTDESRIKIAYVVSTNGEGEAVLQGGVSCDVNCTALSV